MKKYKTYKKVLAVLLSAVFFTVFLFSISAVILMASNNFYNHSRNRIRQDFYADQVFQHLYSILDYYEESSKNQLFYTDPMEYYENTDFAFSVTDEKTEEMFANTYQGEAVIYQDDVYLVNMKGSNIITNAIPREDAETQLLMTATGYIIASDATEDLLFYSELNLYMLGYSWRYPMIAIAFVSFCILAVLIVYLFFAVGHHPDEQEIRKGILEKIPLDVFTVVYLIAALIFVFVILAIFTYASFHILTISILMFLAVLAYLVTLMYSLSFALRIKCGGIGKSLLIYRIFAWSIHKLSAFFRFIPMIWKTVFAIIFYFLADLILILLFGLDMDIFILYYIVKNLITGIIILCVAVSLRKLQKGGEQIANGDLSYQIDTKSLLSDYKDFAVTLNRISDSMSVAVEERIKSERMKTELITNVSHDIKTPLTSIINYVDLLKKETPADEKTAEYLNILEYQSLRLKKLICDLVEVSKASTGNIQVNLEECDICVLLQQAIGEYCEKFKQAGLEAVTYISTLPILITADGNLLWRVFDNLLGNICKYSLSGTRVYLDAAVQGDLCVITFKNISRSPLGITSEELMERFVRGDASRNTEGSGLGLPIAKSLLELQSGEINISTDGDLFKVVVTFPLKKSE
ncbi:MAG: hypothetical protein IJ489_03245 [Clostridia bacterium]|nr:hypothetical protein [Clostridia bacterium]